ncbi:MAG: conjugal transfer protein TraG N-terminal domain-containing protein, partial [Candidatus Nitrosotenuis sp.]
MSNPNPARMTGVYSQSHPEGVLRDCVTAYSAINTWLTDYAANTIPQEMSLSLGIGNATFISQLLGNAPNYFTGYSGTATQFLMHSIGMNHLWISYNKALATNPAEAQALGLGMASIEREIEMSGKLTRANVAKYLPVIKGILHCVLAALTQAMFLMLLTPMFTKILGGYFMIMLWLALWRVGDVVLNSIVLFKTQSYLTGKGYMLANHALVQSGVIDYISMAGSLYWTIPTLAMIIASGFSVYSMVGLSSSMSGTIDSAENKQASQLAHGSFSAGNVSMGNESLWNKSYSHFSAMSWSMGGISDNLGFSNIRGFRSEDITTDASAAGISREYALQLKSSGVDNFWKLKALDNVLLQFGGSGLIGKTPDQVGTLWKEFRDYGTISNKDVAGNLAGVGLRFEGDLIRGTAGASSIAALKHIRNSMAGNLNSDQLKRLDGLISDMESGKISQATFLMDRSGNIISVRSEKGIVIGDYSKTSAQNKAVNIKTDKGTTEVVFSDLEERGNRAVGNVIITKDNIDDFISMAEANKHYNTAEGLRELKRRLLDGEVVDAHVVLGRNEDGTYSLAAITYRHGESTVHFDEYDKKWGQQHQQFQGRAFGTDFHGNVSLYRAGDAIKVEGAISRAELQQMADYYSKSKNARYREMAKEIADFLKKNKDQEFFWGSITGIRVGNKDKVTKINLEGGLNIDTTIRTRTGTDKQAIDRNEKVIAHGTQYGEALQMALRSDTAPIRDIVAADAKDMVLRDTLILQYASDIARDLGQIFSETGSTSTSVTSGGQFHAGLGTPSGSIIKAGAEVSIGARTDSDRSYRENIITRDTA